MLTSILRYINLNLYTPASLGNSYTKLSQFGRSDTVVDLHGMPLGQKKLIQSLWGFPCFSIRNEEKGFQFSKSSRCSCFTLWDSMSGIPKKPWNLADHQQIHEISQKIHRFLGVFFVVVKDHLLVVVISCSGPNLAAQKSRVRSYGSVHFALSWWLQKRQEEKPTVSMMVWGGEGWSSVVMSGTVLRKCQIYGYAFILCVFFFPGRNSLLKVQTSHVLYQFQLITWMSFFLQFLFHARFHSYLKWSRVEMLKLSRPKTWEIPIVRNEAPGRK